MNGLWLILGIIGAGLIILILNHDQGSVLGIGNDQFAQALILSIWGSVIAAAIIPRSGDWRKVARNAVAWVGIFLALMTGYIYRYDLQDIASRMSAGLVPGSPVPSTALDGRDQVMLVRGDDNHFHAKALIDGKPVNFLVDTGASTIVLSHRDAITAGINVNDLIYSIRVSTANGNTQAARLSIGSVQIGAITRKHVSALVAQQGNLDTSLLGMNFLQTLSGFSFQSDRLILTD